MTEVSAVWVGRRLCRTVVGREDGGAEVGLDGRERGGHLIDLNAAEALQAHEQRAAYRNRIGAGEEDEHVA